MHRPSNNNKPSPNHNDNAVVDQPITLVCALAMNMGANYATALSSVHACNDSDCSRLSSSFTNSRALCREDIMAILNEAIQLTNHDVSLFLPGECGHDEGAAQWQ
jgi:hypothetical protein